MNRFRLRGQGATQIYPCSDHLLDQLPLGIVFHDNQGEITAANVAAERILGLSLEHLRGLRSVDPRWCAVHEDGTSFPGEGHPAMEVLRTGEPVRDVIIGVLNPEREERTWIRVSAFPVRDGSGDMILGVYAVFEDISSQRRALERTAVSEARFQAAFNAMSEGMALHRIIHDPDGRASDYRILDVNPAFVEQTGIARDVVIGQLASVAYGGELAPFLSDYERVAQTGQPRVFEQYFAPLGRHFQISVFSPEPEHFVTIFQDITERKHTEEALRQVNAALRESEQRLSVIVANLPGAAYRCQNSPGWPMSFVSEQALALTGYPAQDILSGRVSYGDLIHPDDRDTVWDRVQAAVQSQRSFTIEYRIRHADGAERWVWEHGRGVFNDVGLLITLEGLILDITARKQAEAARYESEERLRLLSDNLPDSAVYQYLHDPDGRIRFLYVSAGFERLTGLPIADVLRDPSILHRQSPPELIERMMEAEAHSKRTLVDFDLEMPMRRTDGAMRWMRLHSRPRRLPDGSTVWDGVQIDITDRKAAEEALREARDTHEAILQNITDGLVIANPAGHVIDINPAALRLHGFASKSEAPRTMIEYIDLLDVRDLDGVVQPAEIWPLARACRGEVFTHHELQVRRRDTGQTLIVSCGGAAVHDALGQVRLGIITIRDISDQKRAEARIVQLAFYDPLTGLPNRRLLEERLAAALKQVKRQGGCLAVMVLDLDHFKAINDALGHSVGDALLEEVARRMTRCVRASDTVARPGGDEFMLVLPGIDADGAAHLAEKLVTHLARPLCLDGHERTISCSLGISLSPRDSNQPAELIAHADTAMYRAKQAGRNRYQFFTEEMQQEALRVMTLEHQLRRALGDGELCMHYQPQVELGSGRPIGLEALVRWSHPRQGLLGADRFVPLAETSNLIIDLGTWVLRAVVDQIQTWAAAGLPLLPVALNLSAQQFRHRERRRVLGALVSELLAETGLASELLELEITENSLLEETKDSLTTFQELRALGVRLTLDDFGTGYSSLKTLIAFPVDRLKIDQSFVRAAPDHPKQAAIVEAILALGHHLNFEVIAEGVETDAQLVELRRRGCRQAQGYLFSQPLPADAVEPWLRRAA